MSILAPEAFTQGFETVLGSSNGWLQRLRRRAMDEFNRLGVPTTKLESWRYTSLGDRLESGRPLALSASPVSNRTLDDAPAVFSGIESAAEVVIIDGFFAPSLSRLPAGGGILVAPLATALTDHRDLVEPHLAPGPTVDGGAFGALNTAFLRDGVLIQIPANAQVKKPIHLRYVAKGGAGTIAHPRLLLVTGRHAEVHIIESFVGGHSGSVTNAVSELVVGPGAKVTHTRVQQEARTACHLAELDVRLARDATFRSLALSLGASLGRLSTRVLFQSTGGYCSLLGLNLASSQQHLDNFSLIDHAQPDCRSRQVVKNVLAQTGSTVFNAKVQVRPGARRTNAHQHNRNLLLSPAAVAHTKPQLEIDNDDVRCSHGATVGQLDPDQVFYLRSRGLDLAQARRELTLGFAQEILMAAEGEALQAELVALVREALTSAAEEGP